MGKVLPVYASIIILLLFGRTAAEASDCADVDVKLKLMTCQAAVTGDHPPLPSAECCDNISHMSFGCLCSALSLNIFEGINKEAAISLPKNCKLSLPPGSQC
ncbi:protein MpLTP-like67 [Marchantia polymorpha subsp. ruderalis]|uniref:Bifunctional inhibitor/plant lipid transfer protein/seed storage helical domain-containing protein n=2 Tax=Marchantia polymorpha TaxID=3197 RepID=A0AAF6B3H5_MARPO|nr:hypothetical protein MARPO_0955s0001 [Marchantia polymorpha]BBN06559.1 hypothetical protein Mp_3g22180 [Marchantia polymorpha subsp. ruderalis]|eukprot:PTQ26575.1 hypothetical protein MARPO_0955s0001 [Marchantia polymorpha]